jgi:predicted outer membrane repeat protein
MTNLRIILSSLSVIALASWGLQSAHAALFNVADGDVAALKSAISTANTNGEDDTIELAANGTYPLTDVDNNTGSGDNGLPIVGADGGKSLTIHGNGATIIRAASDAPVKFRIFQLAVGVNVTMSQLSIVNGAVPYGVGGGIYNDHGTLTLTNCVLLGNHAQYGAGIFNIGISGTATLTAVDSTFQNNIAVGQDSNGCAGGAIYNVGLANTGETGVARLTITRCTFNNNSASGIGGMADDAAGAILNDDPGSSAIVMISDSIFEGNTSTGPAGAILNGGGYSNAGMVIINSSFVSNSSSNVYTGGGAIFNVGANGQTGSLTLSHCTFTANTAAFYGGGISNSNGGSFGGNSLLAITDCTFANNQAVRGGAVASYQRLAEQLGRAGLTVTNSTFNDNSVCCRGGAIYVLPASVTPQLVSNCTFTGNTVPDDADPTQFGGGALYLHSPAEPNATLTVKNCTFSQNSGPVSGGGISNFGSSGSPTLLLSNSILQTGSSGENVYNGGGTIASQGYNLSNDDGGGFLTGTGDQVNTDPMLDPAGLQNNGGPTQTVALLPGSSAINAADPSAPARDQRYYLRNGAPDKGAFEYAAMLAPLSSASHKTHGAAGAFDVDLPLSGSPGIECRSGGANGVHQMILTFATPVTATSANVTNGTGNVSGLSVSGSQMTVDLTGVSNAQQITLTLSGLSDGTNTNNVNIPMRVLLGDTNGNGTVNASDVAQTKGQLGQAITTSNFRNDVNANGTINASDASIVKSQIGTSAAVAPQSAEVAHDRGGDLKPGH